ncbi:hypothetical protein [Halalkalicoccus subterraneus]|uniref:hypothetical protein n=1 Tax=Halalkalicoccus subterraneus TaxID=2675002 RepID=UPI0013CE53FC|nr:hypothetical protein [Halalkalicoccus subterraneus]
MAFTEYVPGMKPGSTIRNIIVGLLYLFFIYLIPFVLAYVVFTNRNGIADELSGIPGISNGGGVVSAIAIFVIAFVALGIIGAVLPADDTTTGTDSATAGNSAPEPDGPADDEELEEEAEENAEEEANEQDTSQETDSAEEAEEQDTSQETDNSETNQEDEQQEATQESDQAESTDGSFSIRVDYDGEWSGAVGSEGSSRSVDGSGTEEIEIDGDPMVISANAQKQDDSSDELTIQILQDGEVVAEQSTTAEYGVASVSESFY